MRYELNRGAFGGESWMAADQVNPMYRARPYDFAFVTTLELAAGLPGEFGRFIQPRQLPRVCHRVDLGDNEALPRWLHTYNHHRGHTALAGQPRQPCS
jgi:hypothetical protein